LGQGLANAVGFALAEKTLAAQFNRPGHQVIDHYSYCFVGDGCLMEGISHEVCSLAGTLALGKLIVFYDDNGISIDGEVEGWFSDDTAQRFASYNWQVIRVDGHDSAAIATAISQAQSNSTQPSLIVCKTIIGLGAPNKQGKEECHGAPLGDSEIALVRETLQWPHAPFEIPNSVRQAWDATGKGAAYEAAWQGQYNAYAAEFPTMAAELMRRTQKQLPDGFAAQFDAYIQQCQNKGESIATRKASQNAIAFFAPLMPEVLGGSADLAGSNLTLWPGAQGLQHNAAGNYVYYGVREFGMTAIANGVALYGGFVPYVATFLVFMEYARNAVRMSALMRQRVVHVYTHDSIGLGEDGPTHQPVEQVANLRNTPNLQTWRPCDTVETAVAWKAALTSSDNPSALILSRQNLPHQARNAEQLANIERGGYVLKAETAPLQAIVIATGSEVALAMQAAAELPYVRVVAMPCAERFSSQSADYRESVLPSAVRARVAVEALAADYWYKFVGLDGIVIGMSSFGESAPAADLYRHFNITAERVVQAIQSLI
jgi:transketolase